MFANMELTTILTFVLGGILIVNGLISILTGRVYEFNANRYTEDSLRAYARPLGFCNLALGTGFVLFQLLISTQFTIGSFAITVGPVVLAAMTVLSIVLFVHSRSVLVRK